MGLCLDRTTVTVTQQVGKLLSIPRFPKDPSACNADLYASALRCNALVACKGFTSGGSLKSKVLPPAILLDACLYSKGLPLPWSTV